MRESFVLYTQINEVLKELTDEQKGQLFQAIIDYEIHGEVKDLSPFVKIAFIPIKQDLDANNKKYDDIKKARSEAGKRSAQNKRQQTQTNENNSEQRPTNANTPQHNVNVNVNEYVNNSPKGEEKEKELSEPLRKKMMEWLQYKRERRESYKPMGYSSLITQLKNAEKEHGTIAVINQINTAMSSGWKGIGLERISSAKKGRASPERNAFNRIQNNSYDFEELERGLIGE